MTLPPSDDVESELEREFGGEASISPLSTPDGIGRRLDGIDLSQPLSPAGARMLIALLDRHQIVCFSGQDRFDFDVEDLERITNHFGAPIPHPKNYANYATGAPLELLPVEQRASTLNNAAFPGVIECLPGADSPAVYIVSNVPGSGIDAEPVTVGGQHWHTDIEFEPVPLSTSLFYVHHAPTTRCAPGGTWVTNPPRNVGFYHPDSPPELAERRELLPLNGETAYADTAGAYAALPPEEQQLLDGTMVRRRFRRGDPGWLAPLVHVNPRTGTKSLHSPVWASRGKRIAPVEVEGMNEDESRHFLDRLESHCLRPEFRYDHVHTPGDVTVWSNFSTLHVAPPVKKSINDPADARLMYRMSCKGNPSDTLPRGDSDEWIADNIVPPYRSPAT